MRSSFKKEAEILNVIQMIRIMIQSLHLFMVPYLIESTIRISNRLKTWIVMRKLKIKRKVKRNCKRANNGNEA